MHVESFFPRNEQKYMWFSSWTDRQTVRCSLCSQFDWWRVVSGLTDVNTVNTQKKISVWLCVTFEIVHLYCQSIESHYSHIRKKIIMLYVYDIKTRWNTKSFLWDGKSKLWQKTLLHNIHSQKWSDKKSLWQSENYENAFFCLKMIIMTKKSKLTKLKFWLKIITMI